MLDAEARALLDMMENAFKDGRPKLTSMPYAQGRTAVDKMSEDCEAAPPDVGAVEDGAVAELRAASMVELIASGGEAEPTGVRLPLEEVRPT